MSKEETKTTFTGAIEEGKHNWKFSVGDLKGREHWDEYMNFMKKPSIKQLT
jgi:polyphosphate kinase 2 (PPK2 family)